jgi:hypothetical protein
MGRSRLSAPTRNAGSTPWPPGVQRAADEACAALPGIIVPMDQLAARWRAVDANGQTVKFPVDLCFAIALAEGQPKAWALCSDGYRQPLSEAAREALGAGPDAQETTLETWRRLYRDRADGLAPWSFARFDGTRPLFDHVSAALCVDVPAREGPRDAATLLSDVLHPENVRRARPERILNLPALLVFAFFLLIVPVGLMVAQQPTADRDQLLRQQIEQWIVRGEFDSALDILARSPPEGMTGLRPLWPALRTEKLVRFRRAPPQAAPLQIVGPRGAIYSVQPVVKFAIDADRGNVLVRVVREGMNEVVFERVVPVSRGEVKLDVELARGTRYVAEARGLDGAPGLDQVRFSVLANHEQAEIENGIESIMHRLETRDAFPFIAFHVYRAHDCYEASLTALTLLEQRYPGANYPLEEKVLLLGDMGLVPQAIVAARAVPLDDDTDRSDS